MGAVISRRNFVRTMAIAGVGAAVFGMTGCGSPQQAESSLQSGTFTGSGHGKFGPVAVELSFDGTSITDAKVVSHEETPSISEMAINTIPQQIVEYQSLDIDAVSGATLTSTAILAAAHQAIEEAGGDPDDFTGNREPVEPSTEVKDINADIVIVGCGAAGTAAAVTAARLGAKKVVVLEKSCAIGGNSIVSAGFIKYTSAPEDLREEMTPAYEERLASDLAQAPEIMPEDHYNELMKLYNEWKESGSTKVFDCKYLSALQSTINGEGDYPVKFESAETIETFLDWMLAEDFEFAHLSGMLGTPWPRYTHPNNEILGRGYYSFYNQQIEDNAYPIEIYLNTPASELIVENDVVVGAKAQDTAGVTYNVYGERGVILATGGFSGNSDMLRQYNETWPFEEGEAIRTTNCFGHDGDGIVMGQAVGAAIGNMSILNSFPFADVQNSTDETTVGDDVDCLLVNKEGKRFMNENLPRDPMTAEIMKQTDQVMYIISDADTSHVTDGVNRYGHSCQSMVDQGQLYMADTIEGLAEAMGVDVDAFKVTVDRYNEIARSGEDPDFGRTYFSEESPIETPPFYASPRTWAMHITSGGLEVDRDAGYQVLDEEGNPIEGLYAAGEVADGSFGNGSQGEGFKVATFLFS